MSEAEELKKTVGTLRELGNDWKENATILDKAALGKNDALLAIKRLCRESKRGVLIEIGLACVAFPEPVVSDMLGSLLIAAGLLQRRMKNSALYVEDVNKTFPHLFKELMGIRQQIV